MNFQKYIRKKCDMIWNESNENITLKNLLNIITNVLKIFIKNSERFLKHTVY
jgi:hypothetical protein